MWVGRSLGQGEQISGDPELSVGLINLGQAVLSCSELLRAAQSCSEPLVEGVRGEQQV